MDLSLSIITILLPLFTFFVLGLVGMKMPKQTAGIFGTLSMLVTAVVAYGVALSYFFSPEYIVDGVRQAQVVYDATWLTFGENLKVTLGIYIDPISAMMLIVISTISFMVHLYSLGYMHGEKGFQRYYAFLSLFTFSMLGLVVATNIFQMFIFFEMVGVSSYLLIGFLNESCVSLLPSEIVPCVIEPPMHAITTFSLFCAFFMTAARAVSSQLGHWSATLYSSSDT